MQWPSGCGSYDMRARLSIPGLGYFNVISLMQRCANMITDLTFKQNLHNFYSGSCQCAHITILPSGCLAAPASRHTLGSW